PGRVRRRRGQRQLTGTPVARVSPMADPNRARMHDTAAASPSVAGGPMHGSGRGASATAITGGRGKGLEVHENPRDGAPAWHRTCSLGSGALRQAPENVADYHRSAVRNSLDLRVGDGAKQIGFLIAAL